MTQQRSMRCRHVALAACLLTSLSAQAYYVSGGRIHEESGTQITLRGVNWFGFETDLHSVHGLWARNMEDMLDQMKALGFNAVRVPVCPATLRGRAPSGIDFSKNPALQGLHSLQVLDAFLSAIQRRGMMFLLDHHRPDCQAISELWYTSDYSEAQWIADLEFMARRYGEMSAYLGLDLKNEPHGAATWGSGQAATDWNRAAERAARAVLAIAPQSLIVVEGIDHANGCVPHAVGGWWGGVIAPQACTPLDIPSNRLVLSPHVYGPDVFNQPYFSTSDFPANMPPIWDAHFGRIAAQGYAVVIGETGGKYGSGDARDKPLQDALFAYLKRQGIRDLFYWSWNPNSGDTGGILNDDWTSVRQDKMALLQNYWSGETDPVPPPPPAPPPPPPPATNANAALVKFTDWGQGYCANVNVTHTSSTPLTWRVALAIEGTPYTVWNAVYSVSGTQLTAQGVSWNQTLAPGNTAQFGFCANR